MSTKRRTKIFFAIDLTTGSSLGPRIVEDTLNEKIALWQKEGEEGCEVIIKSTKVELDVRCITTPRNLNFADFTIAASAVVTYIRTERPE